MINKALMNEEDYQKASKKLYNNDYEAVVPHDRDRIFDRGALKDYTTNYTEGFMKNGGKQYT